MRTSLRRENQSTDRRRHPLSRVRAPVPGAGRPVTRLSGWPVYRAGQDPSRPTADALYRRLRGAMPSLSPDHGVSCARVARQDGLLRRVSTTRGAGQLRREPSTPHQHLICRVCGLRRHDVHAPADAPARRKSARVAAGRGRASSSRTSRRPHRRPVRERARRAPAPRPGPPPLPRRGGRARHRAAACGPPGGRFGIRVPARETDSIHRVQEGRHTWQPKAKCPVMHSGRGRRIEPGLVAEPAAAGPPAPAFLQVQSDGRGLQLREGVQEPRPGGR